MKANSKITKALTWKELKDAYRIGKNRKGEPVNELAEAIADGEILELLQECADELHDGNLAEAVKVFRKNLSSQQCNMKKADTPQVDFTRYELLNSYTAQFVEKSTPVSTIVGKPKWMYSMADIESLAGNHEELRKLYNSMMDKKSKDPEAILNYYLSHGFNLSTVKTGDKMTDDFMLHIDINAAILDYSIRIERVRVLRNEAKDTKPEAPADLIVKLKSGKKLTADETAKVLELLSK